MITSWSPSKLRDYEKCAAYAKYKHVEKLPEPEGPALAYGTEVHGHAEQYVTGRVEDLHPTLTKVKSIVGKLRKEYQADRVRVEVELAVDQNWKPVEWFAPNAWARFKIDVRHLLKSLVRVIDWKTGGVDKKTGKLKETGEGVLADQVNAYSVAILSVTPKVMRAESDLVFVDAGEVVSPPEGVVLRKDLERQQKKWTARVKPMLTDTIFPPRPGNYCRWCCYSRNKGGKCLY